MSRPWHACKDLRCGVGGLGSIAAENQERRAIEIADCACLSKELRVRDNVETRLRMFVDDPPQHRWNDGGAHEHQARTTNRLSRLGENREHSTHRTQVHRS